MSRACDKCKKNVTDKRFPGLSCVDCKKIFHNNCVKLTKETIDNIDKNQLSWSCPECSKKPNRRRSQIFPGNATGAGSSNSAIKIKVPATVSIEKALADLAKDFAEYKHQTNSRIDQLEQQLLEKANEVKVIKASFNQVRNNTEDLSKAVIEKTLEVQGIPEKCLDDPTEAAILLGVEIGCQLSSEEIDCKLVNSGSKPVLDIKFNSSSRKIDFLRAGKKFNRDKKRLVVGEQNHKIFVNEKLTLDQKRLFYNVKIFARTHNFSHVWFCNGHVHLKKSDHSLLIIVRTQEQLEVLAQNEAINLLSECERSQIKDKRASPVNQGE